MTFPLTALAGASASAGCTDHAARERLGIATTMLPRGKLRFNAIALDSKKTGATRKPTTRYTYRLGGDACDPRLSLLRARPVEQYLRTRGVRLPTVVHGQRSSSPRAECRQTKRDDLVRCLAPNRRVEIELAGTAS
ncbi:hypothetical protein B0G69_3914 [Paraburkholderia sp. RAU2J]|uniref:hypothetical protein n=1 Tax=Paraburkholderia sp. RAU2J TaxID=1938810 RepID=UPI000EAE704E|nr:hypothetical protein [Paraburkholderia sp. RAU2J]RKT20595.1 hypothetical protein B0G69_3914 [Paraburkholderia sp. RAU2J]